MDTCRYEDNQKTKNNRAAKLRGSTRIILWSWWRSSLAGLAKVSWWEWLMLRRHAKLIEAILALMLLWLLRKYLHAMGLLEIPIRTLIPCVVLKRLLPVRSWSLPLPWDRTWGPLMWSSKCLPGWVIIVRQKVLGWHGCGSRAIHSLSWHMIIRGCRRWFCFIYPDPASTFRRLLLTLIFGRCSRSRGWALVRAIWLPPSSRTTLPLVWCWKSSWWRITISPIGLMSRSAPAARLLLLRSGQLDQALAANLPGQAMQHALWHWCRIHKKVVTLYTEQEGQLQICKRMVMIWIWKLLRRYARSQGGQTLKSQLDSSCQRLTMTGQWLTWTDKAADDHISCQVMHWAWKRPLSWRLDWCRIQLLQQRFSIIIGESIAIGVIFTYLDSGLLIQILLVWRSSSRPP